MQLVCFLKQNIFSNFFVFYYSDRAEIIGIYVLDKFIPDEIPDFLSSDFKWCQTVLGIAETITGFLHVVLLLDTH